VYYFTKKTTLIIPTKDRSLKVINLLKFFKTSKIKFFEILVIDSSNKKNSNILKNQLTKFKFKYFHTLPSTSHQRNVGLKKKNHLARFVMFLDDDVIFYKNAFKEMNKVILKYLAIKEIGGFGFNQIQHKASKNFFEKIKNCKIINFIGLYSSKPGKVLRSGWHSKILNVKKNTYVDWIYTTACIYKTEAICNLKFDENFGQYSYLEDLDFSLNLKNLKKKIVISYLAKFSHPNNIDRSSLTFGITEVINRFRIVKKHKLDLYYFFIVSLIRFFISFINSLYFNRQYFLRALGNIVGFFDIITSSFKVSKIKK
jgi:GT2 family glycosyltransferase